MARLYCSKHGRDDEADTIKQQAFYREEGECVLIVTSKLRRGPMQCDKCSRQLERGDEAFLSLSLNGYHLETMQQYDWAYVRRYFDLSAIQAVIYGADWPDTDDETGDIRMPRGVELKGKSRMQEPVCALDFKAKA